MPSSHGSEPSSPSPDTSGASLEHDRGEAIDSSGIRKHRNDVFRLLQVVLAEPRNVPLGVRRDVARVLLRARCTGSRHLRARSHVRRPGHRRLGRLDGVLGAGRQRCRTRRGAIALGGTHGVKTELRALGAPYAVAARDGLRALRGEHRSCIAATPPTRFTGNIDLDAALARDPAHAHAPRWDYGVGFLPDAGQRTCAVWVEVHPANPGAVSDVLRKSAWLRTWLAANPTIDALTRSGMEATGTSARHVPPDAVAV